MRFETHFKEIKTGERISFSCPRAQDAHDLMAFVEKADKESVFFPWAPGKTALCSQNAAEYIEKFATAEREALIIARNETEIIGFHEMSTYRTSVPQPNKSAIATAVLQSYAGCSIASQLIKIGFNLAKEAGYETNEAGTDVRNKSAIAILTHLGFTQCPHWFRVERDNSGTLSITRQYSKVLSSAKR